MWEWANCRESRGRKVPELPDAEASKGESGHPPALDSEEADSASLQYIKSSPRAGRRRTNRKENQRHSTIVVSRILPLERLRNILLPWKRTGTNVPRPNSPGR